MKNVTGKTYNIIFLDEMQTCIKGIVFTIFSFLFRPILSIKKRLQKNGMKYWGQGAGVGVRALGVRSLKNIFFVCFLLLLPLFSIEYLNKKRKANKLVERKL